MAEEIGVESSLVESMRNGDKTIELRLGKPRLLAIKEGDVLSIREDFWYEGAILESLTKALEIKVSEIIYFESFTEALQSLDFQAAIPTSQTIEQAAEEYRKFYSKQDEDSFGVVAILFDVVQ